MASGNYAFLNILQKEVGDVTWYVFALTPELEEARHPVVGCQLKFLRSSWMHRRLWHQFYLSRWSWRFRSKFRTYATIASYVALWSWPFLSTLRRDRPDALLAQDYASGRFDVLLLLAWWLGVPLIARHTGGTADAYLGRAVRRWTLKRAACLIVSGRDEAEMLERRFGVPPDRLAIILTPIDLDVFRPASRDAACHAAGLDPARRYLLFVGRLDDQVKRISAMIRVFATLAAEHPDVDFVIAGDGQDRAALRRLADEQAPGRIRFIGWVSDAAHKAHFYNAADCLVLASWREGFPSVVGEAMACGIPVLSSHVGGVSEMVVEGQTGWLFPAGDDRALRDRLSNIMKHPETLPPMRTEARRAAERRLSRTAIIAALRRCFPGHQGHERA
jgi:glycosyltransferase involved in cell wall biosynthesis